MAFWIIIAVMTAAAVGLLLPALLRRGSDAPPRAEYDLRVYRDQLAEVERDAERGLIDPDQAAAARTEIGRRLIAAGEAATAVPDAPPRASKRSNRLVAALVVVLVPGLAVAIYIRLGDPELALHGPTIQTAAERGQDMDALVAELGERLKTRPDDAVGWALYARSLAGLGRFAEAEPALEKAIALNPKDADLKARDAEAQIFLANGMVTPAARTMLERALALDAGEPRARYYLGLADRQAGRLRNALGRWVALEADSPADAPWRGTLAERIAETANAAGIDADRLAAIRREAAARAPTHPPAIAAAPSPPARGPSAADIAAAQKMSPQDRMAMIRGMVQRLADRMKANPNDAEGWRRLARAYEVLGEADKARDASARAAALQGKAGASAPGPSTAEIEAARTMPDAEREQMVRGMVQRLADRLKAHPDDAEGWIRLGRSYGVLGEREKARDAWAEAAALRPKDAGVLTAYAEAIAAAAPRGAPVPPALGPLAERILTLDPKQPGALWYSGLVKEEAGDKAGARERWTRLLALLGPDSTEHAALQKRIEALGAPTSR